MYLNENIISEIKIEESDKNKLPEGVLIRTSYPICNLDKLNANNRVYSKDVWEKVINDKTLQDKMGSRSLFGQAEHPSETQSDLQLTSHVIFEMWIDESQNKVFQKVDVLDTPTGRIIETLFKAGCKVGMSTRAEGDLEEYELEEGGETKKCQRVIADSYKYITTDFTADPSTFETLPENIELAVETIKSEIKNEKATDAEKKFAVALLESLDTKDKEMTVKEAVEKKLIKKDSVIIYDSKEVKVEEINEAVVKITGEGGSIEIDGATTITVSPDGSIIITPEVSTEAIEPVEPEVPAEQIPEDEPAIEPGNAGIDMPAIEDEEPIESIKEKHEIRVGEKFKYGGAEHEIVDITDSKVVTKKKVAVPEGEDFIERTWDKAGLQYIFDEKEKGIRSGVDENQLPTEGEVDAKVIPNNVLRDKDNKYYEVKEVNSTGLNIEPVEDSAGNEQFIEWDKTGDLGLTKVGESKDKLNVKESIADNEDEFNKARLEILDSDLSDTEKLHKLNDLFDKRLGKRNESKVNEMVGCSVEPYYGVYLVTFDDGKTLLLQSDYDQAAFAVASGVVEAPEGWNDTPSSLPEGWYEKLEEIDECPEEYAELAENIKESRLSPTVKKMINLKIKEASVRAERDKALEVLEALSKIEENYRNKSLETKILLKKLKEAKTITNKDITGLRKKLEEKAKLANDISNELKTLQESMQKDLFSLKESVIQKEDEVKSINEKYQKELNEAKETGIDTGVKQVILEYVSEKLSNLGFKIGKNSQALLEECKSIEEVDETFERIRDVKRRNALHSESVSEIKVPKVKPKDPEQERINKDVGKAFEGM